MPFETMRGAPRRIAVIGGGISGMGAAYFLSRGNQVVLFEGEGRFGGHARTVIAGKFGDQPVDTGFIVFNYVNYPHLVRLFDDLDVPIADSDMSFAASIDGGRIEYGLRTIRTVFAQKRNLGRPAFLRMIRDIVTFNRRALEVADDPNVTIGQFLDRLGTGSWFRDYYILPLSGAIWSTPSQRILDFPAQALVKFFQNHALLSATGQHKWYTVDGGSIQYVTRLLARLSESGVETRAGASVVGVQRVAGGALVRTEGGEWETFDDVVFATHSDTTLSLLADSSEAERTALGGIKYQPNEAVLHADASLMPNRKACWSSWNYCEQKGGSTDKIDLTYWMNSLQPIPKDDPMFVTLNSTRPIREELIYDTVSFSHPVYDLAAQNGREAIRSMQGMRNTWFCGAWMKNGFHEDGLASAFDVAEAIKARAIDAKVAAS
ncbi:NAD(P)/FAD-dependent oxidoreductase [Tropicimonas sp. S265A]|uniref:NAD(P)/FAD-dependent oxidoreductase n=1 Tax=Tropicimonas sp. S265A TaxID=3415134 RepID=UPI003C7CB282